MPIWLIGIIALVGVTAVGGGILEIKHTAYDEGYNTCRSDQATAQVKRDKTVRTKYDKIDQQTPHDAGKSVAIDWLLKYTIGR